MRARLRAYLYLGVGHVAFVVGVVAIVVPLVPTTPFILIAGFCYERGSPRIHRWLRENRYFGRYVTEWEEHRSIPRRAKALAVSMITLATAYILYAALFLAVKAGMCVVAVAVSTYILTRPSR